MDGNLRCVVFRSLAFFLVIVFIMAELCSSSIKVLRKNEDIRGGCREERTTKGKSTVVRVNSRMK